MRKWIICGDRNYTDYYDFEQHMKKVVEEEKHGLPDGVISGHARGADTMGEQWAKENNLSLDIFPADWETYGKAAGHIRNAEMLKAQPQLVVAFLAQGSKGTRNMIEQSIKVGKPVKVINI